MAVEEKHTTSIFHVLAVDDSNIDRKLLERLLTVSEFRVTCVDSGDKALEYLGLLEYQTDQHQVAKVNLIMTDYSMPGITGYDLLKKIKDSSWKDVPVIVMSSENVPSRINMCLEGGAEEFLLKPVKLSDLTKLQSHILKYSTMIHESAVCKVKEEKITEKEIHDISRDDSEKEKITVPGNNELMHIINRDDEKEKMITVPGNKEMHIINRDDEKEKHKEIHIKREEEEEEEEKENEVKCSNASRKATILMSADRRQELPVA